jgi:tripartite-type tricarboxylate transporter receptor subunit TctC
MKLESILARIALASLALTSLAFAQTFPTKPITIVVPFSAGGTLDSVARLVGGKMADGLGQPVVIENRTGAQGIIGFQSVAKAPPDGHTLVTIANSFAVNPAVRTDLPYDTLKDFAPVTSLGITPHVLAVHPSLPATSVKELVALAKQKPDTLTYGTIGEGSYSHLVGKMFEKAAGIRLVQVPYRGSAPSIVALLGNQITMVFGNLPEIQPHAKAGKLRALAVSATSRSPVMPELPTMTEAGFPGFHSESWYGLVAPAGTPPDVLRRLQREVARVMALPEVRERLASQSVYGGGETPEEFSASLRALMATYAGIAKETGIKAAAN